MTPTPATVRDALGHILWDLVDLYVGRMRNRGDVTTLAKQLGLSRATLWMRRVALKLPRLPAGRPPTVQLTERQEFVMKQLKAGVAQAAIAKQLGVTAQAIADSAARAVAKGLLAEKTRCLTCGGSGVTACNSCFGGHGKIAGGHSHVCLDCGGASTYWASK